MRAFLPVTGPEDMARTAREGPLAFALFGAFAGQPGKLGLDLRLFDQHLRGLGTLGRFFPFGQAAEEPFFRPFRPSYMGRENTGPWPAQSGERLQRRPCAFAFGPVFAFASGHQHACRLLEQ